MQKTLHECTWIYLHMHEEIGWDAHTFNISPKLYKKNVWNRPKLELSLLYFSGTCLEIITSQNNIILYYFRKILWAVLKIRKKKNTQEMSLSLVQNLSSIQEISKRNWSRESHYILLFLSFSSVGLESFCRPGKLIVMPNTFNLSSDLVLRQKLLWLPSVLGQSCTKGVCAFLLILLMSQQFSILSTMVSIWNTLPPSSQDYLTIGSFFHGG